MPVDWTGLLKAVCSAVIEPALSSLAELRHRVEEMGTALDQRVACLEAAAGLAGPQPTSFPAAERANLGQPPANTAPQAVARYYTAKEVAAMLRLPSVRALYSLVARVSQGPPAPRRRRSRDAAQPQERSRRKYLFTLEMIERLRKHEDPWKE